MPKRKSNLQRKPKKVKPKHKFWKTDKNAGVKYQIIDHGEYPLYPQDMSQ